jgi:hypothetical protein
MKNRAEEFARMIANRAVNDEYIEDGGFIKDWLYDDILNALQAHGVYEYNAGLEAAAHSLEVFDQYPKTAHSLKAKFAERIRALRKTLRVE